MESNPRVEIPTAESGEEERTIPETEYQASEAKTDEILPAVEGAKANRAESRAAEKSAEGPAVAEAVRKVEVAGAKSEEHEAEMAKLGEGLQELRAAFEAAKQYRKDNDPDFSYATPGPDQVDPVGRLLERIIDEAKELGADEQLEEARKLGSEMGMFKFLDQVPPQVQQAEAPPKEEKKGLLDRLKGLFG